MFFTAFAFRLEKMLLAVFAFRLKNADFVNYSYYFRVSFGTPCGFVLLEPLRFSQNVFYQICSWKVLEMTSSCCSFVSLTKFTA